MPLQVVAQPGLPIDQQRRTTGRRGRGLQHRQQRQADRLQQHLVVHRRARGAQIQQARCGPRGGKDRRLPLHPVKARQHRAAKVQRLGPRCGAVEADAEGNRVVVGQVGHATQAQRARQPGAAHTVRRQAPERAEAGEQQKQHRHQRQPQQRRAGRRHVGQHQRGQQAPGRDQHRQRGEQRLRVQAVRQHQEKTQEKHHHRVAPGAQLQRLQRHQHHQHHHAGLAAQQGALAPGGQADGHHQHRQDLPARRQRAVAQRQQGAPDQHHRRQRAAPERQMAPVRHQCPADHRQLEQGVTGVAGPLAPGQRTVADRGRGWRAGPRGRHGRHVACHKASASSALRRWASPLAGIRSSPGRRRP